MMDDTFGLAEEIPETGISPSLPTAPHRRHPILEKLTRHCQRQKAHVRQRKGHFLVKSAGLLQLTAVRPFAIDFAKTFTNPG
jgi:hypothetical protein